MNVRETATKKICGRQKRCRSEALAPKSQCASGARIQRKPVVRVSFHEYQCSFKPEVPAPILLLHLQAAAGKGPATATAIGHPRGCGPVVLCCIDGSNFTVADHWLKAEVV